MSNKNKDKDQRAAAQGDANQQGDQQPEPQGEGNQQPHAGAEPIKRFPSSAPRAGAFSAADEQRLAAAAKAAEERAAEQERVAAQERQAARGRQPMTPGQKAQRQNTAAPMQSRPRMVAHGEQVNPATMAGGERPNDPRKVKPPQMARRKFTMGVARVRASQPEKKKPDAE